jgi:polyisoprenyl-teichoic acid--peptidoglycan teichoic acid transferase
MAMGWRRIGFALTVVILLGSCVGGYFSYQFLTRGLNKKVNKDKTYKTVSQVDIKKGPEIVKPFNLLLLGIDDGLGRDWQGRTDTLVLIRFFPESKKINALSIPRDTLTQIPGHGEDKINHAYAYGGTELAIKTVEKFTGKEIDYYLQLDMDGFVELVDKLGGVEFDLDRNIPWGKKVLKRGKQHLDGEKALAVVRFRYEPMGDIARVKRQMRFIKAVLDKAIGKKEAVDKVFVLRQMEENIETDLSLKDMMALFNTFRNSNKESISAEVVPGDFYNRKRISYWKPDDVKLNEVIHSLF